MEAPAARSLRIIGPAVAAALFLVLTPTAKAGLLSTGPAQVCETKIVHPFASWNDYANYVLIPGGSFEAGTPSWSLAGGAKIVSGNESYFVNGRTDSRSLSLPLGSSVTTPSMCFAPGDWHLRLFAVNTGSSGSRLKVTIIVRSTLGLLSILDGGTVYSSGTWQPSPKVALLLTNVTSLLTTKAVSFRFTPVGWGGAWRIDDVYLDPFKDT